MGEAQRSAIWELVDQKHGSRGGEGGGQLSLASAGGDDQPDWVTGGGSGGMKSDRKLWSSAADGIRSIGGNLRKATAKLEQGQTGFSGSSDAVTGLLTGAEQLSVHKTWERYLNLVARESTELAGKLEKAGQDHYGNEASIKDAFRQQQTKPHEPDPFGGHPSTGGHPSQGR